MNTDALGDSSGGTLGGSCAPLPDVAAIESACAFAEEVLGDMADAVALTAPPDVDSVKSVEEFERDGVRAPPVSAEAMALGPAGLGVEPALPLPPPKAGMLDSDALLGLTSMVALGEMGDDMVSADEEPVRLTCSSCSEPPLRTHTNANDQSQERR